MSNPLFLVERETYGGKEPKARVIALSPLSAAALRGRRPAGTLRLEAYAGNDEPSTKQAALHSPPRSLTMHEDFVGEVIREHAAAVPHKRDELVAFEIEFRRRHGGDRHYIAKSGPATRLARS